MIQFAAGGSIPTSTCVVEKRETRHEHRPAIQTHVIQACSAAALWFCACVWATRSIAADDRVGGPNVLVILCDDLGTETSRRSIRNASCGRRTSIVSREKESLSPTLIRVPQFCTPTRYGLLTGQVQLAFAVANGVLGGLSPQLIDPMCGRWPMSESSRL